MEGLLYQASEMKEKYELRFSAHISAQQGKWAPSLLESAGHPSFAEAGAPPCDIQALVAIRKFLGYAAAVELALPPPPPANLEDPSWAAHPQLEGLRVAVEQKSAGVKMIEGLGMYNAADKEGFLMKAHEMRTTAEADLQAARYDRWKTAVAAQATASSAYATAFDGLIYKGLKAASARMMLWEREVGGWWVRCTWKADILDPPL